MSDDANKITKAPPPAPKIKGDAYMPRRSLNTYPSIRESDMRKEIERGRVGTCTPREQYKQIKADPEHWPLEPDWEVHDAAILVVDLDPREGLGEQFKTLLRPDMSDSMATGSLTSAELATYRHVQTIVRRAMGENSTLPKKHKHVFEDIIGYRDVWIATPADFAKWVMTCPPAGVKVPEWMQALAGEQAKTAKPPVDLENPKSWATYKTVLTLLAKHYGYDPKDMKGPATSKMSRELQKYGLELSDKTIRKLFEIGAGE